MRQANLSYSWVVFAVFQTSFPSLPWAFPSFSLRGKSPCLQNPIVIELEEDIEL